MWQKLKNLFGIKEQLVEESIKFDQINSWFEEKSVFVTEVLKEKIVAVSQKIIEEKGKAKQNLEMLENAKLANPNIPEKALSYMTGNRGIYIKKTRVFLEQINIPEEIPAVLEFCMKLSTDLNEFGKSTARPYAILQEFFANESREVAANMKYIGKHALEIQEIVEDSKYSALAIVKKNIDELHSKIKMSRELFEDIQKKQKLREDFNKKQIEINKKIIDVEESAEYIQLKKNEVELKELIAETKELKTQLEHPFAVMESALKKYHRIAYKDKDLLGKYIESPLEALREDLELKILDLLDRMNRILEDNKIDMKEMKKHKTQVEIKKLTKDYLSRFLADYGRLKKREADIIDAVSQSKVRDNMKKLGEELKINTSMLNKCDSDIAKLTEEVNKIDIRQLKQTLKDNVRERMRIDLSLS